MAVPIYGPRSDVAKRLAIQTGRTISTVYDDRDNKRTIISRWSDAQPAMDEAKRIRDLGPGKGPMRHAGVLPEDTFYALQEKAQRAVKNGEGAFKEVFTRIVRQYWADNPVFKT